MYKALIAVLVLFLAGCSWMERRGVEPHLDHIQIYRTPALNKAKEDIPVHPVEAQEQELSAVFFPFHVQERAGGNPNVGRKVGHVFWRTWLGQEVFDHMSYEDNPERPGRTKARELAQEQDADLYVLGQVSRYMEGGSRGDTTIALLVNIYSTETEELIWSMAHSGRMENRRDMDFVLIKRKTWMPESPEYVVVNNLAHDLAQTVKIWSRGEEGEIPSPSPDY